MNAAGEPRVLVVDDDPIIRELVHTVLSDGRCELLVARNGLEAVRMAKESVPDVVVLDVMMPGMTGFEACRAIRTTPELDQAFVIMLTALDSPAAHDEALSSGADRYLTKPFSALDLLGAVSEAVTRVAG